MIAIYHCKQCKSGPCMHTGSQMNDPKCCPVFQHLRANWKGVDHAPESINTQQPNKSTEADKKREHMAFEIYKAFWSNHKKEFYPKNHAETSFKAADAFIEVANTKRKKNE